MGADGGFRITKIDDIKKDWTSIRKSFIDSLKYKIKNDSIWITTEDLNEANELPDDISELTNQQIIDLFQFVKSCDCPKLLFNEYMVTGEGDYVADQMNSLSYSLPGEYIETWT